MPKTTANVKTDSGVLTAETAKKLAQKNNEEILERDKAVLLKLVRIHIDQAVAQGCFLVSVPAERFHRGALEWVRQTLAENGFLTEITVGGRTAGLELRIAWF